MIKFQYAELVNEDGSIRRLPFLRADRYREQLKRNISKLAEEIKDFPPEPSHFNFNSTQLNRHLRHGETPSEYLPREVADARVRLTPFLRWRQPELRGGWHFPVCHCVKRNGMQVWCPRRGCQDSLRCVTGRGWRAEASCPESWMQRAREADEQLHLLQKMPIQPRGLY